MAHRRGHSVSLERARGLTIDLHLGPGMPWSPSLADLEAAWDVLGDEIVADCRVQSPGHRPWSWWAFTADEDLPARDDEVARLLALGELDDHEQDRVVAAGMKDLWLAPFSDTRSYPIDRANVIRRARGEVPLPYPRVCTASCAADLQLARELLAPEAPLKLEAPQIDPGGPNNA